MDLITLSEKPFGLMLESHFIVMMLQPAVMDLSFENVQTEIDTGKYFNAVKKLIAYSKQQKVAKDLSLNIKDALADIDSTARFDDSDATSGYKSKKFIVQNNQFEMARLQADSSLKDMNEEFSKQVVADAEISVAYDVLAKLKN